MEQRRPALHLRRLLSALALAAACAAPATATPFCLPPVFDGGLRLHNNPLPRSSWLGPALRQHALCWSAAWHPDSLRVAVIGNSAVYGLPLPMEAVFTDRLNQRLREAGVDATLFNLGWVSTYQLRDAMVLDAALAYQPDLIVYPITLSEFTHIAPAQWAALASFFRGNRQALGRMIDDPLPGLEDVLERHRQLMFAWEINRSPLDAPRMVGTFVRAAVAGLGAALPSLLGAEPAAAAIPGRLKPYDCVTVAATERQDFTDWKDWNILAYLADLRDRLGIPVLVVNWPTAPDPRGDCYNARFTRATLDDFNQWLQREASERQLPLVDLSGALERDDFFDTLHVTAEGHRKIAERLYDPLTGLLADARARRGTSH